MKKKKAVTEGGNGRGGGGGEESKDEKGLKGGKMEGKRREGYQQGGKYCMEPERENEG